MSGNVKVRLRSGGNEIEIEAPTRADVDALIERWWSPPDAPAPNVGLSPEPAETATEQRRTKSRKRSRPQKQANAGGTENSQTQDFDANSIANQIKENTNFANIESKIINKSSDWYNKIAFTLWFVDKELTSGQIHKILLALHIKSSLPTISGSLKRNMSSFITPTQRQAGGKVQPTYRLSAPARSEFERWLIGNEQ